MRLKVKKLDTEAKIPLRARADDAGLDLYSNEDVVLKSQERRAIKTGIALEIPSGCVGLIWDRSSVPLHFGLKTAGGVVDAGYRGEIQVIMMNLSQESVPIEKGQKIAQLLIQKVELLEVEEAEVLEESERGSQGFGSTGKH